jgi:hypothetical protein
MTMPPKISSMSYGVVVLASDEPELEAALDELQSALQKHRDYLESVGADCLPLAIRKRLSILHEKIAA